MPEQFAEPDVFRPERFDPTHGEKHTPGAYLPFGAGPRTCLGAPFAMMELKTVLVMLLQRSRLDVIADQRIGDGTYDSSTQVRPANATSTPGWPH